jgi:hypothetical protein
MATRLTLDETSSTLRIRTRATGLLARLAHDLELVARGMRGEASDEGTTWTAELTVPVQQLRVAGTLRGDRLDPSALSTSDRAEIERKMVAEVLGPAEVSVSASGSTRDAGDAKVTVRGRSARARVVLRLTEQEHGVRVQGETELRLSELGIAEIRGPLGAFKVKDEVRVLFDLVLRPAG